MSEHGQGPDPDYSRGPDGARREGQAEYFGHGSEPKGVGLAKLQVLPVSRPSLHFILSPDEQAVLRSVLMGIVQYGHDESARVQAADILTREHPF